MRGASGFRAAANNEDEAKNEDEENLVQVVPARGGDGKRGVARNPCLEKEESLEIPAWHLANNRLRMRQVIALLDTDVMDPMSTDDLIWMMSVRSVQSKLRSNAPTSAQTNLLARAIFTAHNIPLI